MRRLRKRSHRRALPQSYDVVRLAAKSMRVRSIGKVRATVVPVPSSDETRRPRPILSQATAARCSPMPVALWCVRPRLPVKPRSNTRGTSAAGMPSPLSLIASSMQPSFVPASLHRAFESNGLRAVLRRVLQNLADDEVGPFRVGEHLELVVDGELERDPCADERAGSLAARLARDGRKVELLDGEVLA